MRHSQTQEVDFVLTGGLTGKTIVLGRHSFKKGVAVIIVSPENAAAVLTYMARSHQAFPAGSPELAQAQDRDRKNGILRDLPPDSPQTDGASGAVQGAGDHPSGALPGQGALHGEVNDGDKAGSEGLVPGGAGHENSGVGERVESREERESNAIIAAVNVAISKLDPRVDDHWTDSGLPSVAYLSEAMGKPDLSRELIEICAPGFNRAKAEDVAAL